MFSNYLLLDIKIILSEIDDLIKICDVNKDLNYLIDQLNECKDYFNQIRNEIIDTYNI